MPGGKKTGATALPAAKRTQFDLKSVQEVLVSRGYSPAEAMLRIATQAECEAENEEYEISVRRAFLDMSLKANMELLQYVAPKLNRTELTGKDGEDIRTGLTVTFVTSGNDNKPA